MELNAFTFFDCGLQNDLIKYKHTVQWHMMNIILMHTYYWQMLCKMLYNLLFNFPFQRLHLLQCAWIVEENKNLAPRFADRHWIMLFSSLYMSATRTPLNSFISKSCKFYFLVALVFECHGLLPNRKGIIPTSDISFSLFQMICLYAPLL